MIYGLTLDEFWLLTPKELHLHSKAYTFKNDYSMKLAGWQAWQAANLSRARTLPSLKSFLKIKPTKAITVEDQIRTIAEINLALGGKDLRKHG